MKGIIRAFFFLVAAGCLLLDIGLCAESRVPTHRVKPGETLWDLCEKYYGNPDLWPKLWEMNPFITNPHLLKPGDVITLMEPPPVQASPPAQKEEPQPVQVAKAAPPPPEGVDVSGLVNVESVGFLALKAVAPVGYISADETERLILSRGDPVRVRLNHDHAQPGERFTAISTTEINMATKKIGYLVSHLGTVVLKERLGEGLYKGQVVENYRSVSVGDHLLPHKGLSSCILPLGSDPGLTTRIAAVEGRRELAGQFSVVHLSTGYTGGIRRGNILEIMKRWKVTSRKQVASPDVALGHLIVLEVRPETATAVVVSIKEECRAGALVRGVDPAKFKEIVSSMRRCRLK